MNVSKLLLVGMATLAFTCSTEQNSNEEDVASIGSRISLETAEAMIGNVAGRQSEQKRCIYGREMLQEMVNVNGAQGVLIINSLDDTGETRLIFRLVDENGDVVHNSFSYGDGAVCPPNCPKENISSIGKIIEESLAEKWINSFRASNSGKAYSFLFGKNIFNQLLAQPEVEGIAFINGTKSSGEDAMVLVGVSKNGLPIWNGPVIDDGRICPPDCK